MTEVLQGHIVKGVGGFYDVFVEGEGILACRARGIFRKEGMKPLPGDVVEIVITHEKDREGNIERICPRKNTLIRPACANVDQALVVFAASDPSPHLNLLDRFLVQMHHWDLPVIIGLNKADLISQQEKSTFYGVYEHSGSPVVIFSAKTGEGMSELKEKLQKKTTVVAGPSGVGKSSLTNRLNPKALREVGQLSEKIHRGKNTTRETQLIPINEVTFFMDTPGFTSLTVTGVESAHLKEEFPEFLPWQQECAFLDCIHQNEPDCGVKRAVSRGEIALSRYESYLQIYAELKEKERKW